MLQTVLPVALIYFQLKHILVYETVFLRRRRCVASVNADHGEYGPAGVSSAPSLVLALLPTLTAPPAVQRPMGFSPPNRIHQVTGDLGL